MGRQAKGAKARQVIAAFDDSAQIAAALQALAQAGVRPAQVGLLANKGLVDPEFEALSGQESVLSWTDLTEQISHSGADDQSASGLLVAGQLSSLLDALDPAPSTFARLAGWLIPRHAQSLEEQLAAGAILLWVRVGNESEELDACGALLSCSKYPIQVHDCPQPTKSRIP